MRKWIALQQLLDNGIDEVDAVRVIFKEDSYAINEAFGISNE
jgi:hypothetical protein